MRPTPAPLAIAFSERSLRVFGSTAIVRGRLSLERADGRVEQRFLRVYAKRAEGWRAVAVQVFPVGDG
jgi:ketosteroid isomerase-like protein